MDIEDMLDELEDKKAKTAPSPDKRRRRKVPEAEEAPAEDLDIDSVWR